MGKNIKSYATTQVHFPQEMEEGLTAKSPNLSFKIWYGLTVHIPFHITGIIFQSLSFGQSYSELHKIRSIHPKYPPPFNNALCFRHLPQQRKLRNSSELRKFHAVCPHSLRIMQNSHKLLTHYTLCFRHLPRQRKLRNSSKLCKFRAVRPHSSRIT